LVSHEALATQRGGEGLATQKRFNGIVEPGAVRRSMKKLTPWDITYVVLEVHGAQVGFQISLGLAGLTIALR
jgi:hypothetical protein